ncbi:MAG: TRAM domain-containing protein, partial [Megasphaera lornae]
MKERRTIPVTKGKTYEIEIIRLGTNGEGVGKYQDFTVFIPYALPGERIVAVITTVKKTYAVGKLRQVLCASPARVA